MSAVPTSRLLIGPLLARDMLRAQFPTLTATQPSIHVLNKAELGDARLYEWHAIISRLADFRSQRLSSEVS